MINQFSSLIEFLAAVYVTMCLDNSFCQSFWTPNYYTDIDDTLRLHHIEENDDFYRFFSQKVKSIYTNITLASRKRGFYMLWICVFLLVLCGFDLDEDYQLALIPTFFIATVIYLCNDWFFKKWKNIIFLVSVLFFCFLFFSQSDLFSLHLNLYLRTNVYLKDYTSCLLLFLILFPVLHQLFLNWLYSSVFKGYIKSKVNEEYLIYTNAIISYKKGNKKLIHKDYLEALFSRFMESDNKSKDLLVQDLIDVLYSRLNKIVNPSPNKLIVSFCINKFHVWKQVLFRFSRNKPETFVSTYSYLNYEEEYDRYCREKDINYIPLRSYCKQKGLDIHQMITVGRNRKK